MYADSETVRRYMMATPQKSRKRCHCGCKKIAKWMGIANGICLIKGCELTVRLWVRDGIKSVARRNPPKH